MNRAAAEVDIAPPRPDIEGWALVPPIPRLICRFLQETQSMLDFSLLAQGIDNELGNGTIVGLVIALLVFGVLMVFLLIFARYFGLWIQSQLTRANISFFNLLGMTFRKVNVRAIVRSKIMATQAGLVDPELTSEALEAHYLAGGNVQQVIRALIAAKKAKTISLTFREATAIDLAGRDVLESVQTSVYPKVIDCPPRGSAKPSLDAVAKDGIQLKVKARVTVRANLQQLIGGATEETIIARVGEGIVSAIGSAAESQGGPGKPRRDQQGGVGQATRFANGFRDRFDRYRRHRRGRQHRSSFAGRPGRSRHAGGTGPSGGKASSRRCRRTGESSKDRREQGFGRACPSRRAPRDGRSLPNRQTEYPRLLQAAERQCRYGNAQVTRRQREGWRQSIETR